MATAERREQRAKHRAESEAEYAAMAQKYGTEVECGIRCDSHGVWTERFYVSKENYSRWMELMKEAHELTLESIAEPRDGYHNSPVKG